jgi:HK97 gp10 family phage protein
MSTRISIEQIGEVGRQAAALGAEATPAINAALLEGAKIIAGEARTRIPRHPKHRATKKISARHLADVVKAEIITKRRIAGVTVEGGFNGPSFYVKFPEYGTVKMKARRYIAKSAEAREAEVIDTVAAKLKERLGL